MKHVACIGECMIELSEATDAVMRRGFGGDTLNTAVYLTRNLSPAAASVGYVTALGDDPFSDAMVEAWAGEGLDVATVARLPGRLPGLYLIRTDAAGERRFFYWRSEAAARLVFAGAEGEARLEALDSFDLIYFSGITLAILPDEDRTRFLARVADVRAAGGEVAFDPNYRPRLWQDTDTARRVMTEAARLSTVVLPSFADEQELFGDPDPAATLQRLATLGCRDVVVKDGSAPVHFLWQGEPTIALPVQVEDVVDTTGAGDAFNGAYLARRIEGGSIASAVDAGMRQAAVVVRHKGAIIPREATIF